MRSIQIPSSGRPNPTLGEWPPIRLLASGVGDIGPSEREVLATADVIFCDADGDIASLRLTAPRALVEQVRGNASMARARDLASDGWRVVWLTSADKSIELIPRPLGFGPGQELMTGHTRYTAVCHHERWEILDGQLCPRPRLPRAPRTPWSSLPIGRHSIACNPPYPPVLLVGLGKMGGAMLDGWREAALPSRSRWTRCCPPRQVPSFTWSPMPRRWRWPHWSNSRISLNNSAPVSTEAASPNITGVKTKKRYKPLIDYLIPAKNQSRGARIGRHALLVVAFSLAFILWTRLFVRVFEFGISGLFVSLDMLFVLLLGAVLVNYEAL